MKQCSVTRRGKSENLKDKFGNSLAFLGEEKPNTKLRKAYKTVRFLS